MENAGGIAVTPQSDVSSSQQQQPLSLTLRGPRPPPNWNTGSTGRNTAAGRARVQLQHSSTANHNSRPAIPDFNPDTSSIASDSDRPIKANVSIGDESAMLASNMSYNSSGITPTGTLSRYLVSNGFIPAQLNSFTSATINSTGRAFGPRAAPFVAKNTLQVQQQQLSPSSSSDLLTTEATTSNDTLSNYDDMEDEDEEELLDKVVKAARAQLAQQRQTISNNGGEDSSDIEDSDGEDDILSVLMAMESLTTKDPSPVLVDSPSASSSKGATNTPSTEVVEMQSVPVAATTALFVASAKEERIVEATESSPAVSTSHIGHPSSAISATLHDLSSSTTHSTAGQVVNNPLPSPPSPHQTTIPQRVEETHPPSAVSSTSLAADYVNQPLPPIPTSPSFNPLQQQQQQQQLHIQTNRIEQEPYQRPPSHPPSPASVPTLARPASVQSQQSHSSSAMNNSNSNSNSRPLYSNSRPPSNPSSSHPSPHMAPGHPPVKAALAGPPPPQPQLHATPPKRVGGSSVNGEALRATLIRPLSMDVLERMRSDLVGSQDPAQQIRFARFAQCTAESMPMSGTPVNDPRKRLLDDAFAIIDRLAKANNGEAVYIKGTWYAAGKMGNTRDADKALKYYQRAAKLGYPKASFQIGRHYENDPNRAMQFYQRASALGDADANYRMGTIYLNGDLKQKPNPSQALKYLKRAATGAEPSAKAALLLAELLADRNAELRIDPLDRDANEAVHMYHIAAELEVAVAQRELGRIYEDGLLGCPRDPALSASWFQRAADSGDAIAALAMSAWCIKGVPGRFDRDDRAAFEWCRKAVEQGLADAEYAFGYYHEAGIGVQMDKDVAMAWFRKAAAGGSALARERLQQLESGSMNSNMMMSNHQKPPPIIPGYGHLPPPPPSNTSASAATTHYQAAGPPSNITMNHQQGYPSNMMSPTSPSGPLGASFNPPPPPQQPPPSLHHPYHHNGPPANYMAMSGYGGQPQPQQPPPPPQHRPSMGYGQGLPYHQGPPPQQSPQQSPYRR